VFLRVAQGRRKSACLRRLVRLRSEQSRRLVLIFACLAGGGAAACSKSSGRSPDISIEHDIRPQPAHVGPNVVTLKLTNTAGKPVTGAHVAIEGDMSHPGMSPVFGEAQELETGRYRGSIDFAMAGDWVVLLHITLADGCKLERQIHVSGVRAN
jgi:hypothetical protein